MNFVWKYVLKPVESQVVEMPKGAKILTAHEQGQEICIWVLVEETSEREGRSIEVYGTGHVIPLGDRTYIGSVFLVPYALVFHVFEKHSEELL